MEWIAKTLWYTFQSITLILYGIEISYQIYNTKYIYYKMSTRSKVLKKKSGVQSCTIKLKERGRSSYFYIFLKNKSQNFLICLKTSNKTKYFKDNFCFPHTFVKQIKQKVLFHSNTNHRLLNAM